MNRAPERRGKTARLPHSTMKPEQQTLRSMKSYYIRGKGISRCGGVRGKYVVMLPIHGFYDRILICGNVFDDSVAYLIAAQLACLLDCLGWGGWLGYATDAADADRFHVHKQCAGGMSKHKNTGTPETQIYHSFGQG